MKMNPPGFFTIARHSQTPAVRLDYRPCGCVLARDPLAYVWYWRATGVRVMTVSCDRHSPKESHAPSDARAKARP